MNVDRHFGRALYATMVLGFTACGVPGIPRPPSLNLPKPVTDLRAVREGDRVYLAWTAPAETTDNLPVRHVPFGTVLCRSLGAMRPGCAGGVMPAMPDQPPSAQRKSQQTFVDTVPLSLLGSDPNAQIFYAVSVLNQNGRDAGISNVVSVPAIAALPAPADFRARVTAKGVVLEWSEVPHGADTSELRHLYRVYRREEGSKANTVVGETPPDTTQLVDHSFEWEKTYLYRATVVTQIHVEGKPESQFEGDDTPAVKVLAHDVFPPAVPSDLQAVFSGVGQQAFVELIWAPDTDPDLAGYNIYRREEASEPTKINAELQKAPAFRDTNVVSGHRYFYSVSAVDVRGNESARSAEANESVP